MSRAGTPLSASNTSRWYTKSATSADTSESGPVPAAWFLAAKATSPAFSSTLRAVVSTPASTRLVVYDPGGRSSARDRTTVESCSSDRNPLMVGAAEAGRGPCVAGWSGRPGGDERRIGVTVAADGDELERVARRCALAPEFSATPTPEMHLTARDGRARGSEWEDDGEVLEVVVDRVAAAGATRALVTGISTDGTMEGPDLEVMRTVARRAPAMSLIGSGGVGTLADPVQLASLGVEAAIVGRAFYEGRFTYADAMTALS